MIRSQISPRNQDRPRPEQWFAVTAAGWLALTLVPSAPTAAATYVEMTDRALAVESPIIVEGSVLAESPGFAVGAPVTEYAVLVERVLKGQVDGSTIVVRSPGGSGLGDVGLSVSGAPRFVEGETAILFLSPNSGDTYSVQQLMLGAFHRVAARGRELAVRDLSEAQRIGGGESAAVREFGRFADWLADLSAGDRRAPDYFFDGSDDLQSASDSFTLRRASDGRRVRRCEFDAGDHVDWRFQRGGFDGSGRGKADFRAALAAWTDDPTTHIDLRWNGLTTATSGGVEMDGVNAVIFNDPNDVSRDSFSCAGSGGVVATAWTWWSNSRFCQFGGRTHHAITEGDIIGNDGATCYFAQSPEVRAEVFTHEIGHTLGLRHSCGSDEAPDCAGRPVLDDAVMRAQIHNDGRGARLSVDDIRGIQKLYGAPGTDGGGGGGGGGSFALAAPTNFRAVIVDPTRIRLRWKDVSESEEEYRLQSHDGDGSFKLIAKLPADSFRVTSRACNPTRPTPSAPAPSPRPTDRPTPRSSS